MEKFEITILGCGAALPTPRHLSSSQIVNVREKLFMLDCAEGVQTALRRSKLKFSHLNAIFLTHLHGDHCFGLIGLLSTLGLLGRTADIHVYGPKDLVKVFQPQIDFFCDESPFKILLHEIDATKNTIIYEDRSVEISTIPLAHRVPCCGYLIKEKPTLRHIRRDAIDAFNVPNWMINSIKAGLDYETPDGEIIPNHLLTLPPDPIRSYAYCTDTMFKPSNAELLKDVTALYHEATFSQEHALLAKKTHHSTAQQAGEMARLSNAKQLIIGHFSSRYEDENILIKESQTAFENTKLAYDGLRIKLG